MYELLQDINYYYLCGLALLFAAGHVERYTRVNVPRNVNYYNAMVLPFLGWAAGGIALVSIVWGFFTFNWWFPVAAMIAANVIALIATSVIWRLGTYTVTLMVPVGAAVSFYSLTI